MKYEEPRWLYDDEEEPEDVTEEAESFADDSADIPEKHRKADRRGRVIAFIIIGLAVAACVVFFLSGAWKQIFDSSSEQTLSQRTDAITFESTGTVKPFGDICLQIGADGIQAYDINGSELWDLPYTMSNPSVITAENYAAVFSLGSNTIMLINSSGLVNTITTESTLLYGTVSSNGYTAVIMESESSYILSVYDASGSAVVRRVTYSDDDGIPISVAINDDASSMATAYAIYTETTLKSAVTLFNLTDTSSDSIDRIAGNYTYEDTLIADLHYLGDTLIAVGDNLIAGIDSTGNTSTVWTETLSYEITSLSFGSNGFGILLGDCLVGVSEEVSENLIIFDADGTHTFEGSLSDPSFLSINGDVIVYADGLEFQAIDYAGTQIWSYSSDASMQLFALGSDFAVSNNGSELCFYGTTDVSSDSE